LEGLPVPKEVLETSRRLDLFGAAEVQLGAERVPGETHPEDRAVGSADREVDPAGRTLTSPTAPSVAALYDRIGQQAPEFEVKRTPALAALLGRGRRADAFAPVVRGRDHVELQGGSGVADAPDTGGDAEEPGPGVGALIEPV